jgi:hypothetical protein
MAAMLFLTQEMLLRKSGVAPHNRAANNGAEDRTSLSPAKLAEAVQGDQDSDQPS